MTDYPKDVWLVEYEVGVQEIVSHKPEGNDIEALAHYGLTKPCPECEGKGCREGRFAQCNGSGRVLA